MVKSCDWCGNPLPVDGGWKVKDGLGEPLCLCNDCYEHWQPSNDDFVARSYGNDGRSGWDDDGHLSNSFIHPPEFE